VVGFTGKATLGGMGTGAVGGVGMGLFGSGTETTGVLMGKVDFARQANGVSPRSLNT
jgi:hypothetical protein